MNLYFIAIVLPEDLRGEIKSLKEEVKENYGAKHALKIPAHITLQAPFKFPEEEEKGFVSALEEFCAQREGFEVELDGFGSFPPRVIFVRVTDHEPITRLHNSLQRVMKDFVNPETGRRESPIHPHVTIASRDLSKEAFKKAWPEFKHKPFEAQFKAASLFLLKHNGQSWDLFRELAFKEQEDQPSH